MKAKQTPLPGVLPPMTAVQEAALLYVEAKEETARLKERENDRKKDLLESARKAGVEFVKVKDSSDALHIFEFTNDVKVRHSQTVDIKIVKLEKESASA